jgi:hypothetical protein
MGTRELKRIMPKRYASCLYGNFERGDINPSLTIMHTFAGISFAHTKGRSYLRAMIKRHLKKSLKTHRHPRYKLTKVGITSIDDSYMLVSARLTRI